MREPNAQLYSALAALDHDLLKVVEMDPQKELSTALDELEQRVERLRASYEQYFMGYEKIEPGVQRKEVDRRFALLRKQQIRNTALRFRFNVLTQRFNTYATYWARICRQIEEGTYKRHVTKAQRRFGVQLERRKDREPVAVDLSEIDIDIVLDDLEEVAPPREPDAPAAPRAPAWPPQTKPTGPPLPRSLRPAALPPGARAPALVRRRDPLVGPPPSATPPPSLQRPHPAAASPPGAPASQRPRPAAAAPPGAPASQRPRPAAAAPPGAPALPQDPRRPVAPMIRRIAPEPARGAPPPSVRRVAGDAPPSGTKDARSVEGEAASPPPTRRRTDGER